MGTVVNGRAVAAGGAGGTAYARASGGIRVKASSGKDEWGRSRADAAGRASSTE